MLAGRQTADPVVSPHPVLMTPPTCHARDWALLLGVGAVAGALAHCSDRSRPSVAAAAAAFPLAIGLWWCSASEDRTGVDENSALNLLWLLVSFSFLSVFCAAMFGVRDMVRDQDLENAMTDTFALIFSLAPAGHVALLWLSRGPGSVVAGVSAGLAGSAIGATSRWLGCSERHRKTALVAGFPIACILAALLQDGRLCIVAWYSASAAQAYEFSIRYKPFLQHPLVRIHYPTHENFPKHPDHAVT